MSCVELIKIHYLNQKTSHLISGFITQLLEEQQVKKNWDINLFDHYRVNTELLIILSSKSKRAKFQKSDFGIWIAEYLKSYGSVNHSLWIPHFP